jgi:hypothetical protein
MSPIQSKIKSDKNHLRASSTGYSGVGSYSTAVRKTLNDNLDELRCYFDEWFGEYHAERCIPADLLDCQIPLLG